MSVVLPTRNRAGLLPRAVASVLGQTYGDLELIVVDDGSTDETTEVLARIADPRLRVLRLPEGRGAAAARNAGARAGSGELLAFQDSDDEWLPRKLELQLAALDAPGRAVGAVGGRYEMTFLPAPATVTAPALETGDDPEAELLDGAILVTPAWLVRRTLFDQLGGFDERMPCLEDWDLLLRASALAPMRVVGQTILLKHGAPDSLGGDVEQRAPAMEGLMRRHGARFLARPESHGRFCLELAELCLRRQDAPRAAWWAARSLRRRGAPPRAALGLLGGALAARLRERRQTARARGSAGAS